MEFSKIKKDGSNINSIVENILKIVELQDYCKIDVGGLFQVVVHDGHTKEEITRMLNTLVQMVYSTGKELSLLHKIHEYDVSIGSNIDETIKKVLSLSKSYNKLIWFKFNEVPLVIGPQSTEKTKEFFSILISFVHARTKEEEKEYKIKQFKYKKEEEARKQLWFRTPATPKRFVEEFNKESEGEYGFVCRAAALAATLNETERNLLYGDYSGFQVGVIKKLIERYF